MDLEIARSEADKYLKQQGSLSSQLQGQLQYRMFLVWVFICLYILIMAVEFKDPV